MSINSKSLVLVVGAGTSKEVGLPIGNELKSQIATALDIKFDDFGNKQISGDYLITEAFRQITNNLGFSGNINPHLQVCWQIRDAMPQAPSIDAFIASHPMEPKIAECSKLAIAKCILEAEKNSYLYVDPSNIRNTVNFAQIEGTWYHRFFQNLTSGYQVGEIKQRLSKIAIISFNYDRCIEHYLHAALCNWYGIDSNAASAILSHLEIYHPYGSVGTLPYENMSESAIGYGNTRLAATQLITISKGIKTFTEGTDEQNSDIVKIRSTLKSAKKVLYLGFSFLDQNLDLLFGSDSDTSSHEQTNSYGTALGMSTPDIEFVKNELSLRAKQSIHSIALHQEMTCSKLFQHYGRALKI